MADLRKRFGSFVAAHRKRAGMTQEALAELSELSVDMISKIEVGATGARFPAIERLAAALNVDPAELFTGDFVPSVSTSSLYKDLSLRLATLSDRDLAWLGRLVDAALRPR